MDMYAVKMDVNCLFIQKLLKQFTTECNVIEDFSNSAPLKK